MAALASSGQISLDDIIKHRTGAASTDVSLKLESERFASGSVVDGDAAQTTARKNLDTAPYAISELYDADFPNSQYLKFGKAFTKIWCSKSKPYQRILDSALSSLSTLVLVISFS